ncbi:MAG: O-antigen ligase family protein [Acidobacteriaceae bacterium]
MVLDHVSPAGNTPLALFLIAGLCVATLTLWIPANWTVGLFESFVFLLAGIAMVLGRTPVRGTVFPLFVLSFVVLWGGLQFVAGWTINRFATERATFQWMTWAAIYYVGVVTLDQRDLARTVRTVMVWFAAALSVEAILQAYLSPGTVYGVFPSGYHDFVMGPIVYHTHFAAFIEAVFPLALFRALRRNREGYLFLGTSAVLLTAMVVSASRGGLILVLAELITVVVLAHRQNASGRRRALYLALALFVVTAVLVLIVGSERTSARFSSEALAQGRWQFALSTLHMIVARPFFGWGLGCWPAVYPAFATFDPGVIVNQAHSDWLQWTAEGGMPVGALMLALSVWSVKPAIRSIWGIGVLVVLVHAAFDYPFSRPAVGAWPILILAMAAASTGGSRSEAAAVDP